MNRLACFVVTVCLAGAVAVSASAQDALSKRVSLDLKAMAPADAFKVLADSIGLPVVVDQAITAPVDIVVRNVSARTALNTMCESIGCRWAEAGGRLTVSAGAQERASVARRSRPSNPENLQTVDRIRTLLRQKLPPGTKFENAPLAVVNERLSEALGLTDLRFSIQSDDPKFQTLTVDFSGDTVLAGLRRLGEAGRQRAVWRIAVARKGDGVQKPTLTIMLGQRPAKKKLSVGTQVT